ncbi:hypothetical protein [Micromonospora sp. NPDC049282]|uniref:hypothetical protein n=1 Tax=Micromonospora sp. NPDC049282 TaxID=3364269 RepID=UPI003717E21B
MTGPLREHDHHRAPAARPAYPDPHPGPAGRRATRAPHPPPRQLPLDAGGPTVPEGHGVPTGHR